MTSTVRVRVGEVEIEYEGSTDFSKEDLTEFLSSVAEIVVDSGGSISAAAAPAATTSTSGSAPAPTAGPARVIGTTNTIAAKLGVDSGPELIIAACARLTLGLGNEQFDRREITKEMKAAQGYYKKSYMNNMSSYLQRCVSNDQLREVSTGVFALSAKKRQELENILAE